MPNRIRVLKDHCKKHSIPFYFYNDFLLFALSLTHKSVSLSPHETLGYLQRKSNFFVRIYQRLFYFLIKKQTHSAHLFRVFLPHNIFSRDYLCDKILDNEKLEFLGDSILGYIITEYLITKFPYKPEGVLSRIKSYTVSRTALYYVACKLELYKVLHTHDNILNPSLYTDGHAINFSTIQAQKNRLAGIGPLSNAVESIIGALYICRGIKITRKFIMKQFSPILQQVIEGRHQKDYKSLLQYYAQSQYNVRPLYTLLKVSGPGHAKKYTIAVSIKNKEKKIDYTFKSSASATKKSAEQEAAEIACKTLNVQDSEMLF